MHRIKNTLVIAIACGMTAMPTRADKPTPGGPGPDLCFELIDGTVITGRIDAKVIGIQVIGGNDVKVPVAKLRGLRVGLANRPGLVKRVETLVSSLDSANTRQDAQRKLIALGPVVSAIVASHGASDVPARRAAVAEVLKAYETWSADHPEAPEAMARPLGLRSEVREDVNTFKGTVTTKQFRVAGPKGPVTVKLDEVFRICPAPLFGWNVELRDKTHVKGVAISKSLRVQTRYGTVDVPLARIQTAKFADGGKTIGVQYRNSDRIVGTIAPEATISLNTDKGQVDLPVRKIVLASYEPFILKGHSSPVYCVAFSPNGMRLASGSEDKTIKLLDSVTGKELFTLKGHLGSVVSVAFSPDGKRLASVSSDRTIKLWDSGAGKELLTIKGLSRVETTVAFSPDGKRLVSAGLRITLWDSVTGKKLLAIPVDSPPVSSVIFSPDGKRLASANRDRHIKFRDAVTGKELLKLMAYRYGTRSLAFSPDGKRLASGGRISKVWDAVAGKELLTLDIMNSVAKGYSSTVSSVAFSPDGKRLASGGFDRTVRLWDSVTGKKLQTFKRHSGEVYSLSVSPDGRRLVTYKRQSGTVHSVAFSPDGKRLATGNSGHSKSGGGSETVLIWDVLN